MARAKDSVQNSKLSESESKGLQLVNKSVTQKHGFSSDPLQGLQRGLGNGYLQAKLTVGEPDDQYEQEADRIANQIVNTPDSKSRDQGNVASEEELIQEKPTSRQITPLIQRQVLSDMEEQDQEETIIQAKSSPKNSRVNDDKTSLSNHQVNKGTSSLIQAVLSSPGKSLDLESRTFMESRFGHDFSQVQIHTDEKAIQSAQALHAQAYTVGKNVVFGAGKYSPSTIHGKQLIAHELVHVLQQKGCGSTSSIIARKAANRETQLTPEEIILRDKISEIESRVANSNLGPEELLRLQAEKNRLVEQIPKTSNKPSTVQSSGIQPANRLNPSIPNSDQWQFQEVNSPAPETQFQEALSQRLMQEGYSPPADKAHEGLSPEEKFRHALNQRLMQMGHKPMQKPNRKLTPFEVNVEKDPRFQPLYNLVTGDIRGYVYRVNGYFQYRNIEGVVIRAGEIGVEESAIQVDDILGTSALGKKTVGLVGKKVVYPLIAGIAKNTQKKGIKIVLQYKAGMDLESFHAKAEMLKYLAEKGKLVKTKSPVRKVVTNSYDPQGHKIPLSKAFKLDAIDKNRARLGVQSPEFAEYFKRLKSKQGDHMQDLQLGGADNYSNLWLIDGKTNELLGSQISGQLRNINEGTKIVDVKIKY